MSLAITDSFGWEIQTSPVLFAPNGGEIYEDRNFQVLSRDDTNEALAVMSKRYVPMSISDFEKATERMVDISGMTLNGYQEFDGGKVILSILKNSESLDVNGYPIEDYLVLGNSFNGDQPFFIGTSTVLIRCQNQFSKISKLCIARHTKNGEIRREQIFEGLNIYFQNRKMMYDNFGKMAKVGLSRGVVESLIDKVIGIDKFPADKDIATRTMKRRNELSEAIQGEMSALGNNAFGLFNGVTKYTTHILKTRKESPFGNILGKANDINQLGYNYCVSLVKSA